MKTANGSKFAVECNWISKISQNVKNYVFSLKNIDLFFEKNLDFLKSLKAANLRYKATEKSKTSQNVQKLVLINEIIVFLEKKLWFFLKVADGSKFTVEWNWISKMSQTLKN